MSLAVDSHERHIAAPPPVDPVNAAFVARRDAVVYTFSAAPVARLASFLAYLAHQNGRVTGAARIADDLHCGTVADWLGMTVDDLESHLVFLQRLKLIKPEPSGALIVIDVDGLDRLADGCL